MFKRSVALSKPYHGNRRGATSNRRGFPNASNIQDILRKGQTAASATPTAPRAAAHSAPTDSFSFRIGTKFAGFEPREPTPTYPETSEIHEADVELNTTTNKRPTTSKSYEEIDEELEDLDHQAQDRAQTQTLEDRRVEDADDATFGDEDVTPKPPRRTPEEKRAAAQRVRALQLYRQINRRMPAVREWHALSASRAKTIVVQMDSEVEFQASEIAPYLTAKSEITPPSVSSTLSGRKVLSTRDLWLCTKLLRTSKAARETTKSVVTGGKNAIRRIWLQYGIVPNVIYIPDDEEIPSWCLSEPQSGNTNGASTQSKRRPIIIRAPGASINRNLLSADLNDGYAAEFTLDQTSPLFRYDTSNFSNSDAAASGRQKGTFDDTEHSSAGLDPALLYEDPIRSGLNLRAAAFLTQSMVPSNVGLTIRSAIEAGYDAIILDRCADVLNEKVIRASEGTILNPKAKIFQLNPSHGVYSEDAAANIVQKACLRHNLLPLATLPSQSAVPAFEMAQELFYESAKYQELNGNCPRSNSTSTSETVSHATHNSSETASSTSLEQLQELAAIRLAGSLPPPPPKGAMVMLGSEAMGLHKIIEAWEDCEFGQEVPFRAVTLQMTDPRVSSINVAVAGGILLNVFRPAAKQEHQQLFRLGVVPDGAESVGMLPRAEYVVDVSSNQAPKPTSSSAV